MTSKDIYLTSKPRYEILDGLRGVAAMLVLFFHCFETYDPIFGTTHINHGYLAVDFFFMLSGFVIGYAYDDRWDRMTTWGFFKRRLIRLHPMVVAGTLIGAALFFFGSSRMFSLIDHVEPWKFFLCLAMALMMIPAGPGLDIRGWAETNSFNGPNWSLTYEYVGNLLYALLLRHLSKPALAVSVLASAFITLDLTLGWDVFNFFADPKYNVIGGWALAPDHIYTGMGRLLYPFLCGLLMSRMLACRSTATCPSGSPLGIRGGFWWASLLLTVVLAFPQVGGRPGPADGVYQMLAIIFVFPVIVLMGAGSKTTDRKSTEWCEFLGNLSYPLYIVHFPLIYMQIAWVEKHRDAPVWQHLSLNIGIVVLAVAIAWACLKLYDEPVRKWLKGKLFSQHRAEPPRER